MRFLLVLKSKSYNKKRSKNMVRIQGKKKKAGEEEKLVLLLLFLISFNSKFHFTFNTSSRTGRRRFTSDLLASARNSTANALEP